MHKIRQLKYPSIANPATDPAGGPAGEPRLSIPELKLPQKLTASVRATQTSLHKMKLMQISKIFQNNFVSGCQKKLRLIELPQHVT